MVFAYAAAATAVVRSFLTAAAPAREDQRDPRKAAAHDEEQRATEAEDADAYHPLAEGGPDPHHHLIERALRAWYYRLGLLCSRRPLHVLGAALLLVALCCVGFVRFR